MSRNGPGRRTGARNEVLFRIIKAALKKSDAFAKFKNFTNGVELSWLCGAKKTDL